MLFTYFNCIDWYKDFFLNICNVYFTCTVNSAPFKCAFLFSNWYNSETALGHNLMN